MRKKYSTSIRTAQPKAIYQLELDGISKYMRTNGLEFSGEKINMINFNNGFGPQKLPQFQLNDEVWVYKSEVTFIGMYLTTKLHWRKHIEYLLSKATESLNFLKNRQ